MVTYRKEGAFMAVDMKEIMAALAAAGIVDGDETETASVAVASAVGVKPVATASGDSLGVPYSKLPQCWKDVTDVLAAGIDRLLFYGPPGTGKTFGGLSIGCDVHNSARLACVEDMTTFDIAGGYIPAASGFEFQYGIAAQAWLNGSRLVVDECDKASGDVLATMLAFTDSVGSASFQLQNKEIIKPRDGFSVVMTCNVEHPRELPQALKDRFPVAIYIGEPHPSALTSVPKDLHALARKMVSETNAERRASLRAIYAFSQLREAHGVERAAKLIFPSNIAQEVIDSLKVATKPTAKAAAK